MTITAWHSCLGCRVTWVDNKMESPCRICGKTYDQWLYDNLPRHKAMIDEMSREINEEIYRKSVFRQFHQQHPI